MVDMATHTNSTPVHNSTDFIAIGACQRLDGALLATVWGTQAR